jgi:hypothetical protein
MAGQPRKRAMILELEQRTRSYFEDDEHTVLDYVVAWTEEGGTLVKLAAEIAEDVRECKDLTSGQISTYLRSVFGEAQVKPRLDLARARGAHALAEKNLEATQLVKFKDDVPAAKLKSDQVAWIAGKWNRPDFGEPRAGMNVNINIAQLHLDAMRQRNVQHSVLKVLDVSAEEGESEAE